MERERKRIVRRVGKRERERGGEKREGVKGGGKR